MAKACTYTYLFVFVDGELTECEADEMYENYLLIILKLLTNEERCRHWLTLNLVTNDLESLAILNAPLKRAMLVVDPAQKLERIIQQVALPDQTIVELDVSQR